MIAALYSSRNNGGTKDFITAEDNGAHFGWETIEDVYRLDIARARRGQSRKVPKLKYSFVVRDAWTRLNVMPAKIMQVCADMNSTLYSYYTLYFYTLYCYCVF